MTPDQLEIRVLGDFEVLHAGAAIDLPPSRKTKALLAYLAVTGKTHRRERLCEMFWDIPDDPKASLRWSLSKIRQVLTGFGPDMLQADRNSVSLHADTSLDFNRLAAFQRGEVTGRSTAELEAAACLLEDGFLSDLSLPRCPDFEAWRTAFDNDLAIARLNVLRELVSRLAQEPTRALPYAHALRAAFPDNAELIREIDDLTTAARSQAFAGPVPATSATTPNGREMPLSRANIGPGHQETRFCRGAGGVQIAYGVSGRGPPILRAAHWMSHLQYDWESPVWRHWMTALSENNRLIRYDERCNGLSDWDVEDVSFEAMLGDLECVADAAGLDRFTLLGVSQSCALSVAYAVRHPERVSGLVLLGGYVKGWRKRGNQREIATREALATLMREGWGQNNAVFRQLFTSLFIKNANPEQIAALDQLQSRTISPENAWRLQNVFADIDVSSLLAEVKVPTLVLHAREDGVAPVEAGRSFALNIPGARFIELDSANHIMVEGEPAFDRFMAHLRAFVRETAPQN